MSTVTIATPDKERTFLRVSIFSSREDLFEGSFFIMSKYALRRSGMGGIVVSCTRASLRE